MKMQSWAALSKHLILGTAMLAGSMEFAAADLYVTQVGDGAVALSNASTAAYVKKFSDAGSAISTIALPTAVSGANQQLTLSGTSTSEGFIALSTNGQYLTLGGYGLDPGVSAAPQTTASRVIGRIEVSSGAVDTTTALVDAYIGAAGDNGNIRSVASTDGTKFWTTGNAFPNTSGGIRFATFGSATTTQIATTNSRTANISSGQLHVSSMSGALRGVNKVGTGLPEASDTVTLLPGFDPATNSPESAYDFWFKDANTLYVADDRAAASGGGIQKWELNAETWSLSYTLGVDSGARGLAGKVDGENIVLYATTTQASANNLVSIVDTGVSSTFNILATAPTNTAFRGVEFVSSVVVPPLNNADFNGDNIVDGADFLIWQRGFGATGQPDKSTGDATGDGNVNGLDLDQWKPKFGGPPAVAAIGAVPEPASLTLAGLAAIFAAGAAARRR